MYQARYTMQDTYLIGSLFRKEPSNAKHDQIQKRLNVHKVGGQEQLVDNLFMQLVNECSVPFLFHDL